MRKILLTGIGLFCSLVAIGQSKIDITSFSLIQQYYNPALTGNQGSIVKALYRNQWTGFEDAPKTIFASGELSLLDLKSEKMSERRRRSRGSEGYGAENAFGLSVLHDSFGPYSETHAFLSYGSAIRLSEVLNLRWGTALSYKTDMLDGNKLSVVGDDPKYQHLLGQSNRKSRVDINLGIALASNNYYLAYALQDVTKKGIFSTGDDFQEENYSRKQVVQAGFRTNFTDNFGVVINTLFLHDDLNKSTLEGQAKAVYKNMLWAGGGYRKDLAFNLTAGVRLKQLQVRYAYEMPTADADALPNSTNEIGISYQLFSNSNPKKDNQPAIW